MNKKTQKTMFSSNKSDWETPDDLFGICKNAFDIRFDAAANSSNTKCVHYINEIDDALGSRKWKDIIFDKYEFLVFEKDLFKVNTFWLNPPYGRGIVKWVERAIEEAQVTSLLPVLMLLPARTDTKWFELLDKHSEVMYFLRGRLHFSYGCGPNAGKNPAPFPSMLAWIIPQDIEKPIVEDMELIKKCTMIHQGATFWL